MLMRGLQMVYFIAVNNGQTFFVSFLFKAMDPITFASAPILYLYVRGFIKDESRIRKEDLFHFIPLLAALINILPWYFLDAATRAGVIADIIAQRAFYVSESFGIFPDREVSLFRNGLLVTYLVLIWRIVLRSGIIRNRKNNPLVINWILFFVVIITLSNLNILVNSLISIGSGASTANLFFGNYRGFIQATILVVFFLYVFYNPKVLYGYVFVSKEYASQEKQTALATIDTEHASVPVLISETTKLKSTRNQVSSLGEEEINKLKGEMISIMETEQPFLNPDFSLGDLAHQMGLPQHHCSYILNEYVGKNFREWVNEHRVNFFIEHYPSLINTQTIVSIALASGFKNKNTFYSAFEKVTGQKPSQYFSK